MQNNLSVDFDEATRIESLLIEEAESDGLKPVAVCVMNIKTDVVRSSLMDGVKSASAVNAHNKAWTALFFERDTIEFFQSWTQGEIDAAAACFGKFFPLGGGVLLRDPVGDGIVGAVGISNRTPKQDHDLARKSAGIEVITTS